MERVWYVDAAKDGSNCIALAYDEGTVVIKIGSDEPIVSIRYIITKINKKLMEYIAMVKSSGLRTLIFKLSTSRLSMLVTRILSRMVKRLLFK